MLYFVGVGPGDPELITMKAARILREADAIALPDSGRESVVWKIAGEWMENKPVCRLPMPMKGRRADWAQAHQRAAEMLLQWLDQYETIAYPVLGDPGIYASSSYLMRQIAPRHCCKLIPGVPAMCAAAAALGIPLCEQGESLAVYESLEDENRPAENVVLMKSGKQLSEIREACAGQTAYAACNLGMDEEWLGSIDDVPPQLQSYFITTIWKRGC